MKNLSRIEKSGFRRGEYVGYADGVWRVRKHGCGGWEAFHRVNEAGYLRAPTLEALNAELERWGDAAAADRSREHGEAYLARVG